MALFKEKHRGCPSLKHFLMEHLKNGTLTTDVFLLVCCLPQLTSRSKQMKQYFNIFLKAGVNLRGTDAHGRNALFYAAESSKPVLLRALLEQGLDPMAKDDSGEIPLSVAVRYGNLSAAEYLLEKTENPASVVDNTGATLLHKAAQGDVPDIARRLIDVYHISPEVRDNAGRTAVHVAAYKGSCKMLKYLLQEKAADVNAIDNDGRTPLFSGTHGFDLHALKILCKQGADLSVKDKSGLTAWEFALGENRFDEAKFLVGKSQMSRRQISEVILECEKKRSLLMQEYIREIAKISRNSASDLPLP